MSRRCTTPAATQYPPAGQVPYYTIPVTRLRGVKDVESENASAQAQQRQRRPGRGRQAQATKVDGAARNAANIGDELRGDRDLTQDAFDRLLAILDQDREAAGQKYEMIRCKLQKFFECRGCIIPSDLADQTINLVARKIACGQHITGDEPVRYFYGVARNVVREYWRRSARCSQSTESLSPGHHPSEDPVEAARLTLERSISDRRLERLERCLRGLTAENREVIIKYYCCEGSSKITGRRMLAREMGIHSNALRLRVHRIKMKLKRDLDEWTAGESSSPNAKDLLL